MRVTRLSTVLVSLPLASALGAQKLHPERVYPAFGVGPSGIQATIERDLVVTVASIAADSPAAKAKLRPGDVIHAARGRSLAVADPRVPLGLAIGGAEADRGRLVLEIERDGKRREVVVRLPILGPYSETWPQDCAKSRAIVEANAAYLVSVQDETGGYDFGSKRRVRDNLQGCLASLFLLSTGDPKLLPHVERHVLPLSKKAETRKNAGGHVNWQLGYQGLLLSEYYLKTGDRRVLPGLQELCNWAVSNQAAGGWGHGENVGAGYTQSGLMNHAGLPILITLALAQECGLDVDAAAYARAMKLMYRMAGHGCIAYGDHRSELGWSTTNGRNAMLACAFSLLGDDPAYRAASEHLSLLVTDSYYQPEFGHTGGGFNVMWRGLGSAHVPESKGPHFRRQMDELAWYYDLCRQFGGGFAMPATPPDNARYTGLAWGTGAVGLSYTAPRRTLRITGAPRTEYSRKVDRPAFQWGTDADLAFFGTDGAEGFGDERDPPHVVYDRLLGKARKQTSVDYCAAHLRHYSPMVRTWAARCLADRNDAAAIDALAEAARHRDSRVRRAAFDAISGYDNWRRPPRTKIASNVVSDRFLPAITKTLEDRGSAWWEIDGALFALGRALPEDIRKQLATIRDFGRHEDWYLRDGAFWALVGLHDTMTASEFQLLSELYRGSRHVFERASYDSGFKVLLKKDRVAFERVQMRRVIETLGKSMYEPEVMLGYGTGGIHEAAHRTMMILKHFDPKVYEVMVDDFVRYLKDWEPYYQHSVWLITGSKWQPGILTVLDGLGAKGRPIVASLKRVLVRFPDFDAKRIGKAGRGLEAAIRSGIDAYEKEFGKVR